jgi:hypothetical protein
MKKISVPNRIIFLITAHLAGYMIVSGIEGYDFWTTLFFTITFGMLVLSCILLMLFGFEILNSPVVVVLASVIPLSLSLGIIYHYLPPLKFPVLIFTSGGLVTIFVSRLICSNKFNTIVIAIVHGFAGLIIFIIPILLSLQNITSPWFALVGIGGMINGLTGLLLVFIKIGKPIIHSELLFKLFPTLLFLSTLMFVVGMSVNKGIFI